MNDEEQTEQCPYGMPGCREHLYGLLTLVLIVTILALAMWPMLKAAVTEVQYAAEALPAVRLLRTRTEWHRRDANRLPGVGDGSGGIVGATSQLAPSLSKVQTVAGTNAAFAADFSRKVDVAVPNHLLAQVGVGYGNLTGKRLRPQHMQYRVDASESNYFLYAFGVFGDGKGLKAGTGYAVLEMRVGGGNGQIAVWNRYKRVSKTPAKVIMVNAEEAKRYFKCQTPKKAAEMNLCWVGDTEALMSGEPKRVTKTLDDLRRAGWEIH